MLCDVRTQEVIPQRLWRCALAVKATPQVSSQPVILHNPIQSKELLENGPAEDVTTSVVVDAIDIDHDVFVAGPSLIWRVLKNKAARAEGGGQLKTK